jgi:hypothetical protein
MKILIASSFMLVSLGLVSCHTMNDVGRYSNATVGTGMHYGARAVGTGVGFVAGTGAAIGHGVGTVVETGVGLVKQPVKKIMKPRVYRNGYYY